MNRRNFLQNAGAACAALAFSRPLPAFAGARDSAGWRTFEVTTRVEVLKPNGMTRIWLPTALIHDTPYQKTLANKFNAEGGTARFTKEKPYVLGVVSATYPANAKPVLTMTSRVSLKNYAVDLSGSKPAALQAASKDELKLFLQPSRYVPTDGIVKETAVKATAGATTDVDKARAIYEWIVENTFRDPKVKGCGRGDIRAMLESGDLGGKCADLNALYVGMARSVGLPARDIYGLRIAKSDLGYKSLGLNTDRATKSQHCRAEVYLIRNG